MKPYDISPLCERGAKYIHFPTNIQTFIFRNWESVPVKNMAKVLNTDEEHINATAKDMGLRVPAKYNEQYRERGYITVIRNNWHLLPYEQLLTLLDWDEEKLAFTLKEDDFLSVKLGKKPNVLPIKYRPLSKEEKEQTEKIKTALLESLPNFGKDTEAEDFDFIQKLSQEEKVCKSTTFKEVALAPSWGIQNLTCHEKVEKYIDDFKEFAKEKFSVDLSGDEKYIKIAIQRDGEKKSESHKICVKKDEISIFAVDDLGVFRALQYLKMQATKNGSLSFDKKDVIRDTRFDIRFIYSYFALFGDPFSDNGICSYPDSLLKKYSELGINGIWIHSVLYKMCPFPWDKALSEGWENRLLGLKSICDRAEKYGIKVYLYINEPRAMPLDFFKNHPEILGYTTDEGVGTLCTSTKEVRDYLYNCARTICQRVPNLGGFFTIVASENLTNCYSHKYPGTCPCPRCSKKTPEEVFCNVNEAITKGAKSVSEDINVIAWDWAWDHCESRSKAIELHAKTGARIMCTSEEGVKKNICGFDTSIIDYSISIPWPGEKAKSTWEKCKKLGIKTLAKVQFNTSWEGSTLPYIPTLNLIREHMDGICKENVVGIMIGWTLGGCPSPNLLAMSKYFFSEEKDGDVLQELFGENAKAVERANTAFSNAFREYPFELKSLYLGPQQLGPANLLFAKRTNLHATMTCFSYDDTSSWRSIFSYEVYENQFKKLSEKWKEGLYDLLSNIKNYDENTFDFTNVATAGYCIYRSCYLQIKYNRLREELNERYGEQTRNEIINILEEEKSLAVKMYNIVTRDSRIGYEAANHYFFNKYSLAEKIVNVQFLKEYFASI